MNNKRMLTLMLVLAAALLLAACTPATPAATAVPAASVAPSPALSEAPAATEAPSDASAAPAGLELTLEELAKYTGKDGQPAYVAVDDVIYDVTNVPPWSGGDHNGFEAGQDLSEEIRTSPHGVGRLQGVPIIGKLVP